VLANEDNQEILRANVGNLQIGQHKIECPLCSHTRKKNKRDKCLSVNVDVSKIVYHCHHCSEKGAIKEERSMNVEVVKPKKVEKTEVKPPQTKENGKSAEWLEKRGIDLEVAKKCGVIYGDLKGKPIVGFTFEEDGKCQAVKYRSANGEKMFWWEGNASKLWGKNVHNESLKTLENTIIITEGELDTLSIKTAFEGHLNVDCYSVPNGSPSKITDNAVDPKEDGRFKYVWEEREKFHDGIDKIILATDKDSAGDVLAHELSRRLNIARCYRVDYKGHKDANELLLAEGKLAVVEQIVKAEAIPMHNLNSIDQYSDDFQKLYDQGVPRGISTGFSSIDKIFTLATGSLNVVTGYPGDGKSQWIDNVVVNVAKDYGWKTCYCSFEKPPTLHSAQLAELYIGKRFFDNGAEDRMTQEEKDLAQDWINEHMLFQDYFSGELPTIDAILDKASSAVMRYGIRILVIDPFNFIHYEKTGLDTDAISDMLTKIQLWCKKYSVCCFFVAHPAKPSERTGKKNVCTGVDISKSMAFYSKCDMGLTVFRTDECVELHNWKTRYTWHGSMGKVELDFDIKSGRYKEREKIEDFDWSIEI
jgi:twinkle protein